MDMHNASPKYWITGREGTSKLNRKQQQKEQQEDQTTLPGCMQCRVNSAHQRKLEGPTASSEAVLGGGTPTGRVSLHC